MRETDTLSATYFRKATALLEFFEPTYGLTRPIDRAVPKKRPAGQEFCYGTGEKAANVTNSGETSRKRKWSGTPPCCTTWQSWTHPWLTVRREWARLRTARDAYASSAPRTRPRGRNCSAWRNRPGRAGEPLKARLPREFRAGREFLPGELDLHPVGGPRDDEQILTTGGSCPPACTEKPVRAPAMERQASSAGCEGRSHWFASPGEV